jgi:hypothetical protein
MKRPFLWGVFICYEIFSGFRLSALGLRLSDDVLMKYRFRQIIRFLRNLCGIDVVKYIVKE